MDSDVYDEIAEAMSKGGSEARFEVELERLPGQSKPVKATRLMRELRARGHVVGVAMRMESAVIRYSITMTSD